MTLPARILLRVGVTTLSLVLGVGAAFLAVRALGPSGGETGFAEGTPTQLLAFIGALAIVGGTTLTVGLTYLERSFERTRRRSRRRSH